MPEKHLHSLDKREFICRLDSRFCGNDGELAGSGELVGEMVDIYNKRFNFPPNRK